MSVAMLDQWFYMLFLLWRHNGCIMCNSTSHLRCFHHINTTLLYEYKFQYLHQCRRRHNHWTPVVQDFFRYLVDQVSSFSWHFPLSFFHSFFFKVPLLSSRFHICFFLIHSQILTGQITRIITRFYCSICGNESILNIFQKTKIVLHIKIKYICVHHIVS